MSQWVLQKYKYKVNNNALLSDIISFKNMWLSRQKLKKTLDIFFHPKLALWGEKTLMKIVITEGDLSNKTI